MKILNGSLSAISLAFVLASAGLENQAAAQTTPVPANATDSMLKDLGDTGRSDDPKNVNPAMRAEAIECITDAFPINKNNSPDPRLRNSNNPYKDGFEVRVGPRVVSILYEGIQETVSVMAISRHSAADDDKGAMQYDYNVRRDRSPNDNRTDRWTIVVPAGGSAVFSDDYVIDAPKGPDGQPVMSADPVGKHLSWHVVANPDGSDNDVAILKLLPDGGYQILGHEGGAPFDPRDTARTMQEVASKIAACLTVPTF